MNVAMVPQRSPFRYPGGKTWLAPRIRAWLAQRTAPPVEFIEPFAGGAIVSLTYDNAAEIHALARQYNFDTQLVAMKSTHHAEMTELLIGRNLDWTR